MNSKENYCDDITDRLDELEIYFGMIEGTSPCYGMNDVGDYYCYDDDDYDSNYNDDVDYMFDDNSKYRKRDKEKKKMGNILTGQGQSSRKRKRKIANTIERNQIPDLVKHVSIGKVSKNIAFEDMFKYINSMGFTIYALKCVSNTNARFKSFRLTVPHWELNQLLDENLWPKHMTVKQYIFPK